MSHGPFIDIKEKSQNPTSELEQNYIKLNFTAAGKEHGKIVHTGESCEIIQLREVLAYLRGTVNLYSGWANDGKGVWLDYTSVLKAKRSGWKTCAYKPEDMSAEDVNGKMEITANRIYKNLAWTLLGKTWNQAYYERNKNACEMMTFEELTQALDFITAHFYIIDFPQGVCELSQLLEQMWFMYDLYKIDRFIVDPWNTIRLKSGQRDDHALVDAFIELKRFAMKTNSVLDLVNHPKSLHDTKVGKSNDAPYKVVTQHMQLGGSAWDMKMDSVLSIYNPERHLFPPGNTIHFYNLKQKQSEIIGCKKGVYEKIIFDEHKRQYWFDGYNPMTGETRRARTDLVNNAAQPIVTDDLPF